MPPIEPTPKNTRVKYAIAVVVIIVVLGGLAMYQASRSKKAVAGAKPIATLEGHGKAVLTVSFSPDGKTLASGGGDNTIRLWEVATGKPIATLQGHGRAVASVSFSPDGKTLASASVDKTIRLWEVPKPWSVPPRELLNFRFDGLEIEYLPAGEPNLLYGTKGYYQAPN